jgi:D-alanyl-D-alanine dipeptidase
LPLPAGLPFEPLPLETAESFVPHAAAAVDTPTATKMTHFLRVDMAICLRAAKDSSRVGATVASRAATVR